MTNNEKSGWLVIAIFFGPFLLFLMFAIGKVDLRSPPQGVCAANLRRIDRAKEQWRTDHQATNGVSVTTNDVLTFLAGKAMPICPEAGAYNLGRFGEPPTCTVPGHSLP